MKLETLKTREEVKADFANKGISINGWAKANGVKATAVHGVLNGRQSGRIGEGHKAAVLLGLKHGEIVFSVPDGGQSKPVESFWNGIGRRGNDHD